MISTDARRDAIRELLREQEVTSQSHLIDLLRGRGIDASQPILSRDLRALEVAKEAGVYRLAERVTKLDHLAMLLRGARPAGQNLVVVHCEPGAASAIARALEAEELPGLLGTVAGDDTVFVAVDGKRHAGSILGRIRSLVD